MTRYLVLYLLFLLMSLKANVYAQEASEPRQISPDTYQILKDEVSLTKTKRAIKPPEPKEKKEKKPKEKSSNPFNFGGLGDVFKLVAYALIFILIGGILFLIFSNIETEKKAKEVDYDPAGEIEDISEIEAETEFESALRLGNYRLALRMKFIKILQILSTSNLIDWKNEKTNRHYLRELSGSDYHSHFRKSANIYEYYWYGNNPIDFTKFEQCDRDFELFISQLNHE